MGDHIKFFKALTDLITVFSENPLIQEGIKVNGKDDFFSKMFNPLETDQKKQEVKEFNSNFEKEVKEFIRELEITKFHHGLIPYDLITEIVFEEVPREILPLLTKELKKYGEISFENKKEPVSKMEDVEEKKTVESVIYKNEQAFFKIVRHIDLAIVQRNSMEQMKVGEIEALKKSYETLRREYNALEEKANKQYSSMLTQYISILGIFAAILMGAFGAIQGFGSLFDNANNLDLGEVFIISSLGASSVILILFLLLNGVAKLTDRSLSSSTNENDPIIKRHPTIVIVYGVLVFVTLVGAAIELANVDLQFAWQGIWWIFPFGWITYFIRAFVVKDLFFIFKKQ
jgi:hypothetical protein